MSDPVVRRSAFLAPPRSQSVERFLRSARWMARLPEKVQQRVCDDAFDLSHAKNEIVGARGAPVLSWIGVAEGFIKVVTHHKSGRVVVFSGIPANAWVGEGSVIKLEPRRYDLVAMAPCRTVHVPRATFLWLLESSLEFNHFIIEHLNARLGQFLGAIETDRIADPVVRLARAIQGLFDPVIYPDSGPLLKVSQEELGAMAGLSRQRANAALQILGARGVVRLQYGGLFVADKAALRDLALTQP